MEINDLLEKLADFKSKMPRGVKIKVEIVNDSDEQSGEQLAKKDGAKDELDELIDKLIQSADSSDKTARFLQQRWVSAIDAARFSGDHISAVKRAVKDGQIVSRVRPNDRRNVTEVCTRSYVLYANHLDDPRCQGGVT